MHAHGHDVLFNVFCCDLHNHAFCPPSTTGQNVADQITSMQKSIDSLSAEVSSVSLHI